MINNYVSMLQPQQRFLLILLKSLSKVTRKKPVSYLYLSVRLSVAGIIVIAL